MKITRVEIFNLLPKRDCNKCGVATCFDFAKNLVEGKANPIQCSFLSEEAKTSFFTGDWRLEETELRQREETVAQREEVVRRREVDVEQKEQKVWNLDQREKRVLKKERELEEESNELDGKEKEMRQRVRALRADLRERDRQIEAQERKINYQKRQLSIKTNTIEELRAKADQFGNFAIIDKSIRNWMTEDCDPSYLDFPSYLVTVGSTPFSARDFNQFLKNKGYKPQSPGDNEIEIMVIGRTDWTEGELENQIAAREGRTLKIYSQEMFIATLATGFDPFETADTETLLAFSLGHQALEYLMKAEIKWPTAKVPPLEDLDHAPFMEGLSEESPLHSMGYSAGKSGLGVRERRGILAEAFKGNLPWVESKEYMAEWGNPNTRRRLWRMAHHIAWLAGYHQSSPSMLHAVKDWESDLAFLEKTYYTSWMRFTWPSTVV